MGEVLPSAIKEMAMAAKEAGISTTGTVKELMKLMEDGKVISSKVLPLFAKRLSEAARKNKGLEKAMDSNRVAMNRFMFAMQEASNDFFTSGFSEGLTEFFNESAQFIRENGDLWKALGKIVGSVLSGIAKTIKVLTPLFSALGTILKGLTALVGDFSGVLLLALSPLTYKLLPAAVKGFSRMLGSMEKVKKSAIALRAIFGKMVLPLLLGFGAAEELMNAFVTKDKKGILYDPSNPDEGFVKRTTGLQEGNPLLDGIRAAIPAPLRGFLDGDYLKKMHPPMSEKTPIQVQLESTNYVVLDGEIVGESVTKSSSMGESMNRAINAAFTGNY